MRVITRGVIDWETLEIEEEDSYEYEGPVALAKDSGAPPQPVDPYQQAAAQYGLSTGTASYNAALNRPNVVNPLGSTTWNVTGYSGGPGDFSGGFGLGGDPTTGAPGTTPSSTPPSLHAPGSDSAHSGTAGGYNPNPLSQAGLTGQPVAYGLGANGPLIPDVPGSTNPLSRIGSGAPLYTETTALAPQFQSQLQKPIDTSNIPGMPGGPNLNDQIDRTQNAVFQQQMGYLRPEQDLQREQLDSKLAAEGLNPGSAAWENEQARLGRQQSFENTQAAAGAVTAGEQELNNLYGLGSQSLQNQIAARNAPINEFNALNGAPGATANAITPDISGAFGQQYQGALAGYNANVASNNQTTSTLGSLALAAAMFFSDKRMKEDIRRVGKTDEGLPVYTYRFKGDPRVQMGVMAQDVEKEKPEAVFSLGGRGGPKMVNYGAIR